MADTALGLQPKSSIDTSVDIPGFFIFAYRYDRSDGFTSKEDAFKYAWKNQDRMQFLEYADDDLKSELKSEG